MGETKTKQAEARRTPGEWIAVKVDIYDSDPNRWSVCTDGGAGRQYFVATIENGAPGDTLDTEVANARLMAAAPELLAACRKAKAYMDSLNARRFSGECDGESILLSDDYGLTAALNKALGES